MFLQWSAVDLSKGLSSVVPRVRAHTQVYLVSCWNFKRAYFFLRFTRNKTEVDEEKTKKNETTAGLFVWETSADEHRKKIQQQIPSG
jgi:hypothetical protein